MKMLAFKVFFKATGSQEVKEHILVHTEPVNRYCTSWVIADSLLGLFPNLPRGERGQAYSHTPLPIQTTFMSITLDPLGGIEADRGMKIF